MHNLTVSYAPRPDATQEAELKVLASVYRFILDSRAKKNAAGVTSTNGDDAKGRSKDDSSATRNYTSVPWPLLQGHPEAMKRSCRQGYFHTS